MNSQAREISELEEIGGTKKRRTQIINVYDNNLQADQVWGDVRSTSRRWALAYSNQGSLLESRFILSGDVNAHTPD